MKRAIALSKQALGVSTPNPAVGAVIVKEGIIVGEGWTGPPGGPHAEITALNQAGDSASGADMYVTLEPCSYRGRTPPCIDALTNAKIKKIYISMVDPNPKVSGLGIDLGFVMEILTRTNRVAIQISIDRNWFSARRLYL